MKWTAKHTVAVLAMIIVATIIVIVWLTHTVVDPVMKHFDLTVMDLIQTSDKIQAIKDEIMKQTETIKRQLDEINKLNVTAGVSQSTIARQNTEIAAKLAIIAERDKALSEKTSRIIDLSSNIAQRDITITRQTTDIAGCTRKIQLQQDDITRYMKDLSNNATTINLLRTDIANRDRSLGDLREQQSQTSESLNQATIKINMLLNDIKSGQDRIAALVIANEQTSKELFELRKKLADITTQLTSTTNGMNSYKKLYEEVSNQLYNIDDYILNWYFSTYAYPEDKYKINVLQNIKQIRTMIMSLQQDVRRGNCAKYLTEVLPSILVELNYLKTEVKIEDLISGNYNKTDLKIFGNVDFGKICSDDEIVGANARDKMRSILSEANKLNTDYMSMVNQINTLSTNNNINYEVLNKTIKGIEAELNVIFGTLLKRNICKNGRINLDALIGIFKKLSYSICAAKWLDNIRHKSIDFGLGSSIGMVYNQYDYSNYQPPKYDDMKSSL